MTHSIAMDFEELCREVGGRSKFNITLKRITKPISFICLSAERPPDPEKFANLLEKATRGDWNEKFSFHVKGGTYLSGKINADSKELFIRFSKEVPLSWGLIVEDRLEDLQNTLNEMGKFRGDCTYYESSSGSIRVVCDIYTSSPRITRKDLLVLLRELNDIYEIQPAGVK